MPQTLGASLRCRAGRVVILLVTTDFNGLDCLLLNSFECVEDVSELGINHVHHRRVTEAAVRSHEEEHIREIVDRSPLVSFLFSFFECCSAAPVADHLTLPPEVDAESAQFLETRDCPETNRSAADAA